MRGMILAKGVSMKDTVGISRPKYFLPGKIRVPGYATLMDEILEAWMNVGNLAVALNMGVALKLTALSVALYMRRVGLLQLRCQVAGLRTRSRLNITNSCIFGI